jgi:hypothetical protein
MYESLYMNIQSLKLILNIFTCSHAVCTNIYLASCSIRRLYQTFWRGSFYVPSGGTVPVIINGETCGQNHVRAEILTKCLPN